jgi:hypothetical protein
MKRGIARAFTVLSLTGLVLAATPEASQAGQLPVPAVTAPTAVPVGLLSCDPIGAGFHFALPVFTDFQHISLFAYRIDGGPWQYTKWYWGDALGGQFYDPGLGRWVEQGMGAFPGQVRARGRVVGFEYTYYWDTPSLSGWHGLGSCQAVVF